jgi:hypothetical protein
MKSAWGRSGLRNAAVTAGVEAIWEPAARIIADAPGSHGRAALTDPRQQRSRRGRTCSSISPSQATSPARSCRSSTCVYEPGCRPAVGAGCGGGKRRFLAALLLVWHGRSYQGDDPGDPLDARWASGTSKQKLGTGRAVLMLLVGGRIVVSRVQMPPLPSLVGVSSERDAG